MIAQQNAPNILASFDATPSPHKRFNAASLLLAFSERKYTHFNNLRDIISVRSIARQLALREVTSSKIIFKYLFILRRDNN
jgi:hypothetical protein